MTSRVNSNINYGIRKIMMCEFQAILSGLQCYLIFVLIHQQLTNDYDVEHLFTCLVCHPWIFFDELSVQIFHYFYIRMFSLLNSKSCLYILDNTLFIIYAFQKYLEIFSIFVTGHFILLIMSFSEKIIPILMKSNYYFMDHTLDKVSTQGHLDILLNYLKILLYYQNAIKKRISADTNHQYVSASIFLSPKFISLYMTFPSKFSFKNSILRNNL